METNVVQDEYVPVCHGTVYILVHTGTSLEKYVPGTSTYFGTLVYTSTYQYILEVNGMYLVHTSTYFEAKVQTGMYQVHLSTMQYMSVLYHSVMYREFLY